METPSPKSGDGAANGGRAEGAEESPDSGRNPGETWRRYGEMLLAQNNYADAARVFGLAIELNQDNATGLYRLGIALAGDGKLPERPDAYKRALCLKPDYPEVLNNLGSILESQNKLLEASVCFEQAIQIDPQRKKCPVEKCEEASIFLVSLDTACYGGSGHMQTGIVITMVEKHYGPSGNGGQQAMSFPLPRTMVTGDSPDVAKDA